MAGEANYRLLTEATGQRIAAALESLVNLGDPVTIAHGGTGASTAAAAIAARGGVAVTDIVDDLISTATDKPLSAAQGKVLNDTITQARGINKTLSATSVTDFLGQILDDVLTMGIGSYVIGYAWQYNYYCTVMASVQSVTRAVIIVTPQPANISKVFVADVNNNSKTYKEIATSTVT